LLRNFSSKSMAKKSSLTTSAPSKGTELEQDGLLKTYRLGYRLAMETDIGGMRENQDDGFVWRHTESDSVVFAVLDGHGSDLGAFASQQGRLAMIEWLDQNFSKFFENPGSALRSLFAFTQERMFQMYQRVLQRGGFEVEAVDGYLIKRKGGSKSNWVCVHGGASCSIVVLLEGGSKMYTANCGDSSGIMSVCGKPLSLQMLKPLYSDNEPEENKFTEEQLTSTATNTLQITWDHSPDCSREFRRLRSKRPSDTDPKLPHLLIVYDSPSRKKFECPSVFNVDRYGNPTVTNNGKYYKNVRREWASLITTPPTARFHDALAFTRSLGDFHLQTCGITCVPDVFEVDLQGLLASSDTEASESKTEELGGVIVLCSDGVWDNWQYDAVTSFFLDSGRVARVGQSESAEEQLKEFMETNSYVAQQHFGNDADNATAIVCYFFKTSA